MCMGVTRSNSGLFSTPGFVVSPVGKREWGEEKNRREGGKKGIGTINKSQEEMNNTISELKNTVEGIKSRFVK